MASTPNQLAIAAACFAREIPQGDQLGCAIYLWNIMAGLNLTPNALRAASKCFTAAGGFPAGDQMGALLYLINQSGGGGGGSGGGLSGAGSPYGTVSGASGQTYLDTSTDNLWVNNGGGVNGWIELIGS